MSKKSKRIFISFSGPLSREVAATLEKYLNAVFNHNSPAIGNKESVKIFYYSTTATSGLFQKNIRKNIKHSDVFIPVVTEQNVESAWLLFELGIAYAQLKKNEILPFHFLLNKPLRKNHPMISLHSYLYSGTQNSLPDNRDVLGLFRQVVELICKKNSKKENRTSKYYASILPNAQLCEKALADVHERYKHGQLNGLKTEQQLIFPTFHFGESLVATEKTPKDVVIDFENFVQQYIEPQWIGAKPKKAGDDKQNGQETMVVVNQTRFSTFVVFTDGEYVLLYNRKENAVDNPRLDVFGSMEFENRSILEKLSGAQDFLNKAKIKQAKPLYGAAVESIANQNDPEHSKSSTAVMFGMALFVSAKDLQLAVDLSFNNNADRSLSLHAIEKVCDMINLTAKARLAVKQLAWLEKSAEK